MPLFYGNRDFMMPCGIQHLDYVLMECPMSHRSHSLIIRLENASLLPQVSMSLVHCMQLENGMSSGNSMSSENSVPSENSVSSEIGMRSADR